MPGVKLQLQLNVQDFTVIALNNRLLNGRKTDLGNIYQKTKCSFSPQDTQSADPGVLIFNVVLLNETFFHKEQNFSRK